MPNVNAIAEDVAKPIVKAELKPALENRLSLAEHARNLFCLTVEAKTPVADVLLPEFWAFLARRLTPMDEVIVYDDSLAYRLHLVVTDVRNGAVDVQPLSRIELRQAEMADDKGMLLRWKGPFQKWAVIRADGAIIKGGFANKVDAQADLASRMVIR